MFFKKWEISLALRYVFTSHKDRFISVINLFSLIGISLGVATLIVVMAVMNGYESELIDKILGFKGHLTIITMNNNKSDQKSLYKQETDKKLSKIDDITDISEILFSGYFTESQCIVASNKAMNGAIIKGVDSDYLLKKPGISSNIDIIFKDGIILGVELARKLGVKVGDDVKIISPSTNHTIIGNLPKVITLKLVNTIDFGIYDYNAGIGFIPLKISYKLFDNQNKMIEIVLKSINSTDNVKKILLKRFPDISIIDWQENNQSLVQAIKIEQNVMFLILSLIIMIATFNIISSLVILVKDKSKSIAILRTMGATKCSIINIFIFTGSIIGIMGTSAGMIIGIIFTNNIDKIKKLIEKISGNELFDPIVYFLTKLPAKIIWTEIFFIGGLSLFFSFIATIYPAIKVAEIDPAKTLRYD
ncbi:lipoprotein-releasing ABC transporter permease subunit [Lyticum sinuosum]|uniref:Lipoprotein-releasing system transmembrane protein LolE n=1 Tax=Lyticum sinuosum TaxID=1332059 RepID=A0AAE4VLL9_9RICK|nr:lipoprotein-releasing ABC transporter permease subunit [Lyticum sinuosum]MDZ5761081.1 Lipoprotein-releasing system transmembrane protein LolE [Lyticum sinuosum]